MAEVQYTKTAVMKTSDGDVTLEQGEARAIQKMLDDNPRFFKIHDTAGVVTYYDIMSASCGFCKVLTITPGTKASDEIPCEDGIPNCPAEDAGTVVVDQPTADAPAGNSGEATE